jgi:tRNA A37 threonylcarbamoyladenosine synthetase subunit TsaC/SUA5/YrdC
MTSVPEAIKALQAGALIHLPTETVYGLGARADDPEAVIKVFEAKGRHLPKRLVCLMTGLWRWQRHFGRDL